ncbi:lysophosphatidic acid receptor 4-like [Dendronephthya gigantea]|uniref:lysophosphatidic acid receptor 4-like n=1 Tax=Dendronephthya gigantea TaxID=151771 RepID=UPI00106CF843|nr:lysophosphatidic acid receptor 4-like [Dendronephthya gigantea]
MSFASYAYVSVTLLIMLTNMSIVMPKAMPSSLKQCNSTVPFPLLENVSGREGNWSQVCNITHNNSETLNKSDAGTRHEGTVPHTITIIVDAIGVLSNTLLILAILVDPLNLLRKGAWFTILNLSIADFTASLSNFLMVGLQVHFNRPNPVVLRTCRFFWYFGSGGSFLLLALLTAETYVIVKYPIRSKTMLTAKKVRLLCAGVWIIAILLGISNVQYAIFKTPFERAMKFYIAQIAVLELAVIVQVLLKVLIIREILRSEHSIGTNSEQRTNKHKEIAKTIVILNVMLIVTAFPYFVAKQIEYLYRLKVIRGDGLARFFSYYYQPVAVLNFALNPILYSLRLPDYRRSLFALPCHCEKRVFESGLASMRTALS